MTLLSREAILQAEDLKHEDVPVPEWGGTVRVRAMTGAERDAFGATLVGADGKPDLAGYRAKLLARCIVGEDGKPLFTDAADMQALASKSAPALDRVFAVADRLNKLSAGDVEAAQKN